MLNSLLFAVSKQTTFHNKAHSTVASFASMVCCSVPWQLIFKMKLVPRLTVVNQTLVFRPEPSILII